MDPDRDGDGHGNDVNPKDGVADAEAWKLLPKYNLGPPPPDSLGDGKIDTWYHYPGPPGWPAHRRRWKYPYAAPSWWNWKSPGVSNEPPPTDKDPSGDA